MTLASFRQSSPISLLTVKLIAIVASLLILSGCGVVSTVALHGVYIESDTGQSFSLWFGGSGADFYMNTLKDPNTGEYTATALTKGSTFKLIGDTVRIEGGTATPEGQALTMFSPPGGSNVTLLKVTDNGQSLELTTTGGRIIKFIKQ